jgi:Tfp pilus assembly protein PilF
MAEPSERAQKLRQMLEKSPGDTFLIYALAMESKKSGNVPEAVRLFDQVILHDWGYCYAYHQKGLLLESTGDIEGAKAAYRQGIDAAERKGDGHAKEEIAASLAMIE